MARPKKKVKKVISVVYRYENIPVNPEPVDEVSDEEWTRLWQWIDRLKELQYGENRIPKIKTIDLRKKRGKRDRWAELNYEDKANKFKPFVIV